MTAKGASLTAGTGHPDGGEHPTCHRTTCEHDAGHGEGVRGQQAERGRGVKRQVPREVEVESPVRRDPDDQRQLHRGWQNSSL